MGAGKRGTSRTRGLRARSDEANTTTTAEASIRAGTSLRLPRLAALYGLDAFETDCLLICLLPELELRYERIYAYLQDDVTKKRPSVDLVLSLLSPTLAAKLDARHHLSSHAPLFAYRLVEIFEEPSQPHSPLLAKYLKVDDRVVSYLLGSDELDLKIRRYARKTLPDRQFDGLILDSGLRAKFLGFLEYSAGEERALMYLRGPYGAGKRSIAEALCRERGLALLIVDLGQLLTAGDDFFDTGLRLLHREALLQKASLFFKSFDAILVDEKKALAEIFLPGSGTNEGFDVPRRGHHMGAHGSSRAHGICARRPAPPRFPGTRSALVHGTESAPAGPPAGPSVAGHEVSFQPRDRSRIRSRLPRTWPAGELRTPPH